MSPKSVAAKWPEQDALFWRIADDLIDEAIEIAEARAG